MLLAEWEAEEERSAERDRQNPERAARWAALRASLNGGDEPTEDEQKARSLAAWAEECALWCSSCRSEFNEGDVVHRRREQRHSQWGGSWALSAICDKCVSGWHPTWKQHREEPIPCAGGCGVLVSHWYHYSEIRTCSRRCSERIEKERRRVEHEVRRCEVCEEEFTPKRSDARYCSNACRQDAYRKRQSGAA